MFALEKIINCSFSNKDLLKVALTPPAAINKKGVKEFERLEFLGDRVLGLVVAEKIYSLYLLESEGDLAKRLAFLTSREYCHQVATSISLEKYVNLPEKRIVGSSILANTIEAIIAAIFIDRGLDKAKEFIFSFWEKGFATPINELQSPKAMLQEIVQAKGWPLPIYKNISVTGFDHNPEFTISVIVNGKTIAEGMGKNKKHAEIDAAKKALSYLRN